MAPSDQKTMNKRDETWKVSFFFQGRRWVGGWLGGGSPVWSEGPCVPGPPQRAAVGNSCLSRSSIFSRHCFVITASTLALSALWEGVASSAASQCVFSVASAGHVQSKNKEGDLFFGGGEFCCTAKTLLFFSNSALVIRSSLLVAIRGWERLTPIMLLSKKSALLIRANEIIKVRYLQIRGF